MVGNEWNVKRAKMRDLRETLQKVMLRYRLEPVVTFKEGLKIGRDATYPVFIIDGNA